MSVIKRRNIMSQDGGNGYKAYIFKESTRYCAINRKGRGRKEVIYLRIADVSCTRGITYPTTKWRTPPCGERDTKNANSSTMNNCICCSYLLTAYLTSWARICCIFCRLTHAALAHCLLRSLGRYLYRSLLGSSCMR